MAITLEIPKDLADRLRMRAAACGVTPEALVARLLSESLEVRPASPSVLSPRESELHQRISVGFDETFWSRFHDLNGRHESGPLPPVERSEFESMTGRVEELKARQAEAVAELAALRGSSFAALWDEMGLGPRPVGK